MLSLSELLANRTFSVYAPIITAPTAEQAIEQVNATACDAASVETTLVNLEDTITATSDDAPFDIRASSSLTVDWLDDDDLELICHDINADDNQIDYLS